MDKQFARILMLSVLLPAGAALAEAIQHEHMSFAAVDQEAMRKLAGMPLPDIARELAPEEKRVMAAASSAHAMRARDEADGGASGSNNAH